MTDNIRRVTVDGNSSRVQIPLAPQTKDEILRVANVLYLVSDCVGGTFAATDVHWPELSDVPIVVFTRTEPEQPKPVKKAKPSKTVLRPMRKGAQKPTPKRKSKREDRG